ncbi:hypothetical protein OROGR_010418 [Orobanche gracilis]
MSGDQMISAVIAAVVCMGVFCGSIGAVATVPELGSARVVFQTNFGDIEFGFYHSVAPKTVEHIFKLVRLGCYNANHFFRVDKGFVAQVADVSGGRSAPMNEMQRLEAEKKVVGEFSDVKHVRGILSMGRIMTQQGHIVNKLCIESVQQNITSINAVNQRLVQMQNSSRRAKGENISHVRR